MGYYYLIVNDDRNEYIDPTTLPTDRSPKLTGLLTQDTAGIVIGMLIDHASDENSTLPDPFGAWSGDALRVLNDQTDEYAHIEATYTDISPEAGAAFDDLIGLPDAPAVSIGGHTTPDLDFQ